MKRYILCFITAIQVLFSYAVTHEKDGFTFELDTRNKTAKLVSLSDFQKSVTTECYLNWDIEYNGETYRVTTIGDHAFENTKYSYIHFEGWPVTTIERQAFVRSEAKRVYLPSTVTSIGPHAFAVCPNLLHVLTGGNIDRLPDGLTTLPTGMFMGCSKLEKIIIPKNVTQIDGAVFSGCSSLSSVTIESTVTNLGGSVFLNCTSLSSIRIPWTVKSVEASTFTGCTALKNVYCEIALPNKISDSGSFGNLPSGATLHVPYGSKVDFQKKEYAKKFSKIVEYIPDGYYTAPKGDGNLVRLHKDDEGSFCSFDVGNIESIEYEVLNPETTPRVSALRLDLNGDGVPEEREHTLAGTTITFGYDEESEKVLEDEAHLSINNTDLTLTSDQLQGIDVLEGPGAITLIPHNNASHPMMYHTTFYSGYEAYTMPDGVKAYTAKRAKKTIDLKPIEGNILPKGEPVVIYSPSESIQLTLANPALATASTDNMLVGNDWSVAQPAEQKCYDMDYDQSQGYMASLEADAPMTANKAYYQSDSEDGSPIPVWWNDDIHHKYTDDENASTYYHCSLCGYNDDYRLNVRIGRIEGEDVSANTHRGGRAAKFEPVVLDGVTYTLYNDYQYAPIVDGEQGTEQEVFWLGCVASQCQGDGSVVVRDKVSFTDEFPDVPVVALGEELGGKSEHPVANLTLPETLKVIERYSYLYYNGNDILNTYANWTNKTDVTVPEFAADFERSKLHFLIIPEGTGDCYRDSRWVKDYGFRLAGADLEEFKSLLLSELEYTLEQTLGGEDPREIIAQLTANIRERINALTNYAEAETSVYPLTDSFFSVYRTDEHNLVNEAKLGVVNDYLDKVVAPYLERLDAAEVSGDIRKERDAALSIIAELMAVYNHAIQQTQPTGDGVRIRIKAQGGKAYEIKAADVQKIEFYRPTK